MATLAGYLHNPNFESCGLRTYTLSLIQGKVDMQAYL